MTANASRNRSLRRLVDLLDRVVGRGDRIDEVLALRGQERVARLEVVELIDRHHVDRAHPLDLGAEVGDHLVGRHRPRAGDGLGSDAASAAGRRRLVFDLRRIGRVVHRLAGWRAARRVPAARLRRRPRRASPAPLSTQAAARCARSDSAVARATSSCAASARTPSTERRASRMRVSCALKLGAQRLRRLVGRPDALAQLVERAQPGVELALRTSLDRRRAAPRGARVALQIVGAARRALSSSRAGLFETLTSRSRARSRARPAPRAPPWPRPSAAPAPACRSRASNSRRCAVVQLLVRGRAARARCARSIPAPRPAAPPARAAPLPPSGARSAICSCLRRDALGGVAGAADLQLEADDRLLLPVQLALQRRDRRLDGGDGHVERRDLLAQPLERAAVSSSARSRSSLISRLVVRMPRASARVASFDPLRAAEDLAVERGDRRRRTHATPAFARLARVGDQGVGADPARWRPPPGRSRERRRAAAARRHGRTAGRMPRDGAAAAGAAIDEPDAAGVPLAGERKARGRLLVRLHDDVLEQIAEAGLDRPLVAPVDLEVVGDRSDLRRPRPPDSARTSRAPSPYSARAASSSSSDFRRASTPASSCSRARSSAAARLALGRARRPAPSPAPRDRRASVSSASRARAIASSAATRSCAARCASMSQVARSRPRACRSARRSACARRAACSIAWRSAVAALTAANTSLRAASTSPSSPSMLRWTIRVLVFLRRAAPRRPARARRSRACRRLAPSLELQPRRLAARFERARPPLRCPAAADAERLDLLLVERDLLLQPADLELAARAPLPAPRSSARRLRSARAAAASSVASTSATCAAAAVSRARASASRPRAASIASPSRR